ncbi:hypothetical protein EVAR_42808_1 [Eumeta japonica]|uniref:Uncharacterized protein n=1 Tax=Eumeta variegata TaxID=151549 RepID=A0A4C1WIZ8_EUMVA|nr:hypothetical protein EVAR_42808_1 [Eumeta japonica]
MKRGRYTKITPYTIHHTAYSVPLYKQVSVCVPLAELPGGGGLLVLSTDNSTVKPRMRDHQRGRHSLAVVWHLKKLSNKHHVPWSEEGRGRSRR